MSPKSDQYQISPRNINALDIKQSGHENYGHGDTR